MKRYCLVIDIEKCENCNNCFLACKDEHVDNDWTGYTRPQPRHGHRWMNILRKERGTFPHISVAYRPTPCYHCEDAPCVRSSGESGAIVKREDGIVLIDPVSATGRKDLLKTCPHGAIWWNDVTRTPQKCTLCAHLLDNGWKAPRCVQACPTGALTFHRLAPQDMNTFIQDHHLEAPPGTRESGGHGVWYKNSHLFFKGFIAGSVATRKNGKETCVSGVTAVLEKDETRLQKTCTDGFGDYRFQGVPEESGIYHIRLIHKDVTVTKISCSMGKAAFAGTSWI